MTYTKREVMMEAWRIYRKEEKKGITFGEALHRAWNVCKSKDSNKAIVEKSAKLAGISEVYNTWYGWRTKGYEVPHGTVCAFQATVADPARGDGKTFVKSYFTLSQVVKMEEVA